MEKRIVVSQRERKSEKPTVEEAAMEGEQRCYHDKAFSIKPKTDGRRAEHGFTVNSYSISFNIPNLKALPNQSVIRFCYLLLHYIDFIVLSPYIRRTLSLYTFKPSDGFISSCIYSEYLVEATQNQTEEEGIYYYYYCKSLPRRRRGYYGSSKRKLN